MIDISYQENTKYFVRYFFDLLIFVVVNIILMNVIFGIIIDTFAELRDKKKYIDNDIKNICSVCSLNRQLFDKFAQGFEHHVVHEHNPWNYLFYIFGLRKKDSTEYDGLESYVSEMQLMEDISWIPMMRALSVKDAGEKEDGGLNKKMEMLLFELKKINKVLSSAGA
jgi:inositol 1,4,5-triphosphate receptor type 3